MSANALRGHNVDRTYTAATLLAVYFLLLSGCSRSGEDAAKSNQSDPASTEEAQLRHSQATDPAILAARRGSHETMLLELQRLRDNMADENPYLGDAKSDLMRSALAEIASPSIRQWELLGSLGQSELCLGNEREAIKHFTQAFTVGKQLGAKMLPGSYSSTLFATGVGYLRLGETENCCARNLPESCLFPIPPSAVHEKQLGSREAISAFEALLQVTKPQSLRYKQTQWLLNIAYMTLGEYPDKVPREYRIGPKAFQSEQEFPAFPNVADDVGLNTFSLSGGAIAEDFNHDGLLDLMVSTWAQVGQMRLFRNTVGGKFVDVTDDAGLSGLYGGLNMVQGDYNNDGHIDVYIMRGAWLGAQGRHPNSLLRNNGDGTFTDVTFLAGLGDQHFPTQTAGWSDYDLDGDLDLYVGNEPLADVGGELTEDVITSSQLFRNNGDETFTDVASAAGVTNRRFAKAVIWGDYDDDRWPDLYVSNLMGDNRLYHNNGDGTFTDVAPELQITKPTVSFPAWFWDYDNDGHLDIYVSSYAGFTNDLVDFFMDRPVRSEPARLYHGTRSGFVEKSQAANLRQPTKPMGSNFGDLNNDGYLDFYLGTGEPRYDQLMPNVMYLNRKGGSFADVTVAGGFGNLQKGHAVVFVDVDNDGDQDIFQQMGGAFLGDRYYDILYRNPGFGNSWIAIELIGVESNRSAIGTRIKVNIDDSGQQRSIFKHVNSGGSFGGNPLLQTIGLSSAEIIHRIEIYWPKSDTTQVLERVPVNCRIRVTEGQVGYETN